MVLNGKIFKIFNNRIILNSKKIQELSIINIDSLKEELKNNSENINNINSQLEQNKKLDEELKQEIKSVESEISQIGCLLVRDNRIISQGYNGFLPGCPHKSIVRNNHEQATVHAEQNAICDCAKRGVSCDNSTAYITHYPCIICTRLMLASGVKKINYINDYKNDELVKEFCDMKGVKLEKI